MMGQLAWFWKVIDTPLLSLGAVTAVILIGLQMKMTEELELVTQGLSHHGRWIFARRLALWLKMLAWLWCVYYGATRDWDPWPPFVAIVWSFNFYAFSRIMVMRMDLRDHAAGRRSVRYYSA